MASRLDQLKAQKKQNEEKSKPKVNQYDEVLDVLMNRPNESKLESTSKEIVDIDVSLIDTDEINEQLFGYEDLNKIESSFDNIGNNSVIYVYRRDNGRYLCFAGNQRLIATKKRGDKTITCVIAGKEPSESERIEQLIFMNSQRTPRPYYIARQLAEYEKILRKKGKSNVTEAIEEKFNYKGAMQRRYKQILKLDETLQDLFKREDIPFAFLLDKCNKLPSGKEQEFVNEFNKIFENEEVSTELINKVFITVTKKLQETSVEATYKKTSQVFKELAALPYYENNTIIIPDNKKKIIKEQALQYQSYLEKIISACD